MVEKRQLNVYLPADLIRRTKHAAIEVGVSLSQLTEDAVRAHLSSLTDKAQEDR